MTYLELTADGTSDVLGGVSVGEERGGVGLDLSERESGSGIGW
jgi:hypothetical protein